MTDERLETKVERITMAKMVDTLANVFLPGYTTATTIIQNNRDFNQEQDLERDHRPDQDIIVGPRTRRALLIDGAKVAGYTLAAVIVEGAKYL